MTTSVKITVSKNILPVVGVTLIVGFLIGFSLDYVIQKRNYQAFFDSFKPTRLLDKRYNLIGPLIGIESNKATSIGRLEGLDEDVLRYRKENKDKVTDSAMYFRDLNSSQWLGFNEEEGYVPASLLKLAVALVILREEEDNNQLSHTKRVFTQNIADIEKMLPFLEQSELKVGSSYDTDFLLRKMIVDSDNGAKDILFSTMNKDLFFNLFTLLGIHMPTEVLKYKISPKDYSFFLRVLYGATYLGPENSQKLLKILTEVKFSEGLVKGVPQNITVAHKFGTFTFSDDKGNAGLIELHDCGIIYHPKHPYILCIMTKGQDANNLAAYIAGLSSLVYKSADEDFGDN